MLKRLKRMLGIPSPSENLIHPFEVKIESPEEIAEAVELARKREIWERQNLPLGR